MLSFGAPWWLAAIALLPVVRWLHRWHRPRNEYTVSLLSLWRDVPAAGGAGADRQQPARSWRRRAALLVLLALALAEPGLQRPHEAITVWVDDSLSMAAVENGRTRLAAGLESIPDASDVVLRSLTNPARRATRLGAIRDWPAEEVPRPPPPTLLDAARQHWLLTDGASPEVRAWAGQAPLAGIVQIGEATENVALTRLARRAGADDTVQVLVNVHNAGRQVASRRVTVAAAGRVLTSRMLEIPPGDTVAFVHADRERHTGLEAWLEAGDVLPLDDRLTLAAPRPVTYRVAAACPEPLQRALRAHPRLQPADAQADLGVDCGDVTVNAAATLKIHSPATRLPTAAPVWMDAGLAHVLLQPHWLRVATLDDSIDGDWLLTHGAEPLLVHDRENRQLHVALDMSAAALHTQPEYSALVAALIDRVLGRVLLDDVAATARAPSAAVIAPVTLTSTGTMPMAATSTHALQRYLLAAALLLLFIDALALRAGGGNRLLLPLAGRFAAALLVVAALSPASEPGRTLLVPGDGVELPPQLAGSRFDVVRRDGDTSGLASALQRRGPGHSRVVVIDDGRWPASDADLLPLARDAGLDVYWHPIAAASPAMVVEAPAAVPPLATFAVRVRAENASVPGEQVVLESNGRRVDATVAGQQGAVFLLRAPASGDVVIDATWRDSAGKQHRYGTRTAVSGDSPRILVLGDGDSMFARSLEAGGWVVDRVDAAGFDAARNRLGTYGLIVLDDVAAHALQGPAWNDLAYAVRRGGAGLLVLGGPSAYGAGAYRHSTLEALLPVTAEPPDDAAPAAVAFVVDVSGSMAQGNGRLGIARDAVLHAASALRADDHAGLWLFDAEVREAAPLAPRSDHRAGLQAAWPRGAGGGTVLLPAIEQAMASLAAAPVSRRLLIAVTDGELSADERAELSRTLASPGIEPVVMRVGSRGGTALQATEAGAGTHFIVVNDVLELPRLVRSQVESRIPAIVAGPLEALPVSAEAFGIAGASLPAFAAANATRLRPGATLQLASAQGLPLLASWNAGAGRVAAMPAGLGAWAGDWYRWDGWPGFAARLTASLQVREAADARLTATRLASGRVALSLDAPRAVSASEQLVIEGLPAAVTLQRTGPGRYEVEIDAPPVDRLVATRQQGDGRTRLRAALAQRTETEVTAQRLVNSGLLERLPDGGLPGSAVNRPLLLAAALILLLVTIAAERLLPLWRGRRRGVRNGPVPQAGHAAPAT